MLGRALSNPLLPIQAVGSIEPEFHANRANINPRGGWHFPGPPKSTGTLSDFNQTVFRDPDSEGYKTYLAACDSMIFDIQSSTISIYFLAPADPEHSKALVLLSRGGVTQFVQEMA
jgi:hypothetical protein